MSAREGITAIPGVDLGHWTDETARTGCTVILCKKGAVAGVDVRGAAPGTRETDLLKGYNGVDRIHGILLTGGSAFGLDAAGGVMEYLEEQGIGVDVGVGVVPIVPAAVLFDLAVGDAKRRPGKAEGYLAARAASSKGALRGRIGAGTGATVGKAFGMEYAMGGGVGSAALTLPGGVIVAAIVAVNALGDVYDHHTGQILAGAKIHGAFRPCMAAMTAEPLSPSFSNTTIGVVATNARLTREACGKLASMGHDGLAMSIRPVHTNLDGDTVFALATGEVEGTPFLPLMAAAGEVMALAIENAVADA